MEPPPYAAICWADAGTFYVQLPSTPDPVTLSFPIANGGIGKALPLLQRRFKDAPRPVSIPAQAYSPHKERIDAIFKQMRFTV